MTEIREITTNVPLEGLETIEKESPPPPPPPPIIYRNELVFLFFNAMLDVIVESWEPLDIPDDVFSIPSGDTVLYSKSYTQLADHDLSESVPYFVDGSNISLVKLTAVEEEETKIGTQSIIINTKKRKLATESKTSKKKVIVDKKSKKQTGIKVKKNLSTVLGNKVTKEEQDKGEELKLLDINDLSWMIESKKECVKIIFKNGNIYEGPVFRKLMHGSGTFTWSDGTKYEGDFWRGKITGTGMMRFSDLSWYNGSLYNGRRHGNGSMYISGAYHVYNGEWQCGLKHGRGWLLYGFGNWYEGEWRYDLMHGAGLRRYADGSWYSGGFEDNLRHGAGCLLLPNGDFYNGNWGKGKRNGYGEYTWKCFFNNSFSFPIQNKYRGSWKNDCMHGVGVIYFGMEGGARYAGCYHQNKKHGPGVVVCENGDSVESNPLFVNDKPVHLTESGSINISEMNGTVIEEPVEQTPVKNQAESYDRRRSTLQMVAMQLETKDALDTLDKAALANIELCKLKFPVLKEKTVSFRIPINTPGELINVSFYLEKISKLYDDLYSVNEKQSSEKNSSLVFKTTESLSPIKMSTIHCVDSSLDLKKSESSENTNISEHLEFHNVKKSERLALEEKWLRNTITLYLPKLRLIYAQYACIGCLRSLSFKPLLIKIFLWQMYRDCKIPENGISLVECSDLLNENPGNQIENVYNPFEVIFFWQFLHSLITIAWKLYVEDCRLIWSETEPLLKNVFWKFIEKNLLPNVGKHKGSVLFDYLDLLPIQDVYKWYQTLGEPHTILQFLQNTCTIKKREPPFYYKANGDSKMQVVKNGTNVSPVAHDLFYLQDEDTSIVTELPKEDLKPLDSDPFRFKLFIFRNLGAKTILKLIKLICPGITSNKDILNLNYKLTFLEFYEIVLKCAQKTIDREKKRKELELKKANDLIKRQEAMEESSVFNGLTESKKKLKMKKSSIAKRKH